MSEKPSGRSLSSALELKIPPVGTALLFALLMWLAARHTPAWAWPQTWRLALAMPLLLAAAAVGLAGVRAFHRARTTVNPLNPAAASALVTDGIFRYSRNPMYLALLLALLAWGLALSNLPALALACGFVPWLNRFQIVPEERALERAFGAEFDAYRARVRRWL